MITFKEFLNESNTNIPNSTVKFIYESKVMSFKEFVLSEGISLKEVQFGSNFPEFNDKKTYKPNNEITSYWFIHITSLYWVWVEDKTGDVAFMKCSFPFLEETKSVIKQIYLTPTEYVMGNQKGSYNAINIFGEILYVVLKLAEKTNTNEIKFNSYDSSLDRFYALLVKNKPLLNSLKSLGWSFEGIMNGNYIFQKVG